MDTKTYAAVTSAIFAIVALVHLVRVVAGWDASVGGWDVPMWLSWVAVLVAGVFAWSGYRIAKGGWP